MKRRDPLDSLLGELQQAIMDVVWEDGEVTGRHVYERLRPERQIAYTTVTTVMNRLTDKGVLEREMRKRTFVYRATQRDRGDFIRKHARRRIHVLLQEFGEVAIPELVAELNETDEELLDALAALLAEGIEEDRGDEG